VRENLTGGFRTGSLTVAGTTVTVSQNGSTQGNCTYTVEPASAAYVSAGGAGSATVTTSSGCSWTAVSNVSWVRITSAGSGVGSATVTYTVSANTTGAGRLGTLTIAGKTVSIKQK
jgi:hypothetical protein